MKLKLLALSTFLVASVSVAQTDAVQTKSVATAKAKAEEVKTQIKAKTGDVKTQLKAKADDVKTQLNAKTEEVKTKVENKVDAVKIKTAITSELAKPMLKQDEVLNWSNDAAMKAFNYDFTNFQQRLQNAKPFFTQEGWKAYMQALNDSKNLAYVIKNKIVVSAKVMTGSKVMTKGVVNDVYSWKVTVPLEVKYLAANAEITQNLLATVTLIRLPAPAKIGIVSFMAKLQPEGEKVAENAKK